MYAVEEKLSGWYVVAPNGDAVRVLPHDDEGKRIAFAFAAKLNARKSAPVVSRQAELDVMQSERDNGDRFY